MITISKEFIHTYLPVVRCIVRQYGNVNRYQDLMQEGMIGLIVAAQHYKSDMNVTFESFAAWHIRRCVYKAVAQYSHIVRLPEHIQWDTVEDAVPLQDHFYANDEADTLADEYYLKAYVHQQLSSLPEMDRRVICALYGIGQKAIKSNQLALQLGVPDVTVRQIHRRALQKLRKNTKKSHLL